MRALLFIFSFSFFITPLVYDLHAQGELDLEKKIILRDERSFGIFLNSNGLSGDFQYLKRINARNHKLYQLELMLVKHPKEIRLTNTNSYYSQRSFVFGKQNVFFELRGQYGRESELFRKNDKGGISMRYFYSLGPTIGILKPIYYEMEYLTLEDSKYKYTYKTEKFNTAIHQSNVAGRSSFFKGFNEISLIPGISAKMGLSFEYSRQDISLHALDIGLGMDLFIKEIPIMATENNNFYFFNLYAGYRFGKVINISEAALKKSWFEKVKEDRQMRKKQRKAEDPSTPSGD